MSSKSRSTGQGDGTPSIDLSAVERSGDDGLSEDDVFDILSNGRRRRTLHYLMQRGRDNPPTLRDLSRQVAAWENDTSPAEVTADERRRVYIALHQTHLPRMDDAGVVEYESTDDEVVLSAEGEDLHVYLDVVRGDEIPWSEFYLGLGAFASTVVAAVWAGAYPFRLVPDVGWAAAIAILFTVVGAIHTYYAHQRQLGVDGAPPDTV